MVVALRIEQVGTTEGNDYRVFDNHSGSENVSCKILIKNQLFSAAIVLASDMPVPFARNLAIKLNQSGCRPGNLHLRWLQFSRWINPRSTTMDSFPGSAVPSVTLHFAAARSKFPQNRIPPAHYPVAGTN
jgi:hypothetical protein